MHSFRVSGETLIPETAHKYKAGTESGSILFSEQNIGVSGQARSLDTWFAPSLRPDFNQKLADFLNLLPTITMTHDSF